MDRTLSLKFAPVQETDFNRLVDIGRKSAERIGDVVSFTRPDLEAMLSWARLGPGGLLTIRDEGTTIGLVRYYRFLDLAPRTVTAIVTLDPEFRRDGVGGWAYRQILERALSEGAEALDTLADSREKEAIAFLGRRGFEKLVLLWTLEADPDFAPAAAPHIPAGFRLREYRKGDDTALMADMHNRTFDRHISFAPCTLEDARSIEGTPLFDPRLTLFLETEQGEAVGYARNTIRSEAHDAWIDLLGVLPEYQGRGLGRFMLLHSMYLVAQARPKTIRLVVEGTNDRARALYDSEGFMEICTRIRYRKKLV